MVTAVVCTGWTVDWLCHATQTSRAFGQLSDFSVNGLGSVGTMATFGALLLAVWAAATAGLLWTSAASEHFRR